MYRFDLHTIIRPLGSFAEPQLSPEYAFGAATGYPSGQWSQHLTGTDCNGQDEPVSLVLTSGHRVDRDGCVRDSHVTDVRSIHVCPDYTAGETAELVLSACERAGISVNIDAREMILAIIARDIHRGFAAYAH